MKSADVGFYLNCPGQDAVGKIVVDGRMLTEQPGKQEVRCTKGLNSQLSCRNYKDFIDKI